MQINRDTKIYCSFSNNPGNNGCLFFNQKFQKENKNAIYKSFYSDNILQSVEAVKTLKISGFAVSMPFKIEILNCPSEKVDIAVGELFEIKFSVQAGSADIISIFYLFELNDEYYSRLPLDRESHSDLFDFPSADQKIYSSTYVEKKADGDEYWVTIDVIDEDNFFSYDLCVVKF